MFYENIKINYMLVETIAPHPVSTGIFDRLENINYYINQQLKREPNDRYNGFTIKIYKIK